MKSKYTKLKDKQATIDDGIDDGIVERNNEMTIEIEKLKSEVARLRHLDVDTYNYKNLAERQYDKIKNLEKKVADINQAKNENNETLKEQVTFLESDNKYLKNVLFKLQQDYKNLKSKSNGEAWTYESTIVKLKEEVAFLKKKRVHKKKIEEDINDFNTRSNDMINWYKNNRMHHTNEFVQFQKETEFLINDVLDYFRHTFTLDKSG